MSGFSCITFNPVRSLGIPGARYIKPDDMFRQLADIKAADLLLFPRHWQVPGLVYGLGKAIFPSPATYFLGHDKVDTTRGLMAACPQMVPKTGIFPPGDICFDTLAEEFGLPFVCKEPKSSCGLGVYKIDTEADFREYAGQTSVIYVQEYLPIDRDLRVVIIGDKVIASYWRVGEGTGFHNNLARGGRILREDIPGFAVQKTLDLARQLGIDYAGFDVAVTPEGIYILEFNPWFGTGGLGCHLVDIGHIIQTWLEDRFVGHPGKISA